ncbi:MAG: efflux transporter outer membrane subunit [Verrucomicrobiota bacterium]|jgi:NodT family efflux transporter outer membrane factor (OMF) lipoprotein|nr:efflux transporter outer membrane subunit [Verrucomicrobiota bacterium]
MRRTPFITAAVLLLAGCATDSNRTARDFANQLPGGWSAPSGSTGHAPTFWWHNFRDDGLSQAIGKALAANPDVWSAAARLEAAWTQAKIAGADQLPQIGLTGGLSASQMNLAKFGVKIPDMPDSFLSQSHHLTLGAQWEFDLWGRVRAGKRLARANALGRAAEFAGTRHSLAGQVAKAWLLAIESRQQARLAKFAVSTHETTVVQVQARFEQGILSSVDLRLAKVNLAGSEAQAAELESVATQSIRRLEILLGQFPANKLAIPQELPLLPAAIPAGVPAEILSRRPDLVAAEQRLFATGATLAQAKATLYPQISLTASGGTSTSELDGLLSGDSVVWNVASNLTQPVFQAGRLRANVRLQRANLKAAEESFRSTMLNAMGEVENALDAAQQLAAMDAALGTAYEQSQAAAQTAQERYDHGLGSLIVLLEARRRAVTAESRWWAARRRQLENRVNLHLALGGGFETLKNDGTARQ